MDALTLDVMSKRPPSKKTSPLVGEVASVSETVGGAAANHCAIASPTRRSAATSPTRGNVFLASVVLVAFASLASASDPAAVERGRKALLENSHIEGRWTINGFRKIEKEAASFEEKYGLFPPPYENHGLPMGLRRQDGAPNHVVLD